MHRSFPDREAREPIDSRELTKIKSGENERYEEDPESEPDEPDGDDKRKRKRLWV